MAEILRNRDGIRRMFGSAVFILAMVGQALAATNIVVDADAQLESAVYKEVVRGDLSAAAAEYRAILARPDRSRSVAARALYRLGQSLEKMGRRSEAHEAYMRVSTDYGDQLGVAAKVRPLLANWDNSAQGPANLRFEEGVPGKLPAGWFVPALPQDADRWAQLKRGSECKGGASCAVVLIPENAPIHVGDLMQSFSAKAYRGKTLRLRAWMRLEKIDHDDRAQMWLSVDRPEGKPGLFDNMMDRPVRAADWTLGEIRMRVPEDATFIKFGVMSIGRGKVWVDGVSFEAVP
jgi:hypothetical protein